MKTPEQIRKDHTKATTAYRKRHPEKYREYRRFDIIKPPVRYSLLRYVSKKRGLVTTISKEEFYVLLSKPCYYCGESLAKETGYCLDRIDNKKHYTLDNVLPCCGPCNRIKNKYLTVDEMKFLMEKLKFYRSIQKMIKGINDASLR